MPEFASHDFLRWLARDVAGTLEEVVGLEEAKGYLSLVAEEMGQRLDASYSAENGSGSWSTETVSEVLVDLKSRIDGNFVVESVSDTEIVMTNSRCPFGDAVLGRPALCMMTSNVFGRISANHLGAATVDISESIAQGDGRCVVRVATSVDLTETSEGSRQYFADLV